MGLSTLYNHFPDLKKTLHMVYIPLPRTKSEQFLLTGVRPLPFPAIFLKKKQITDEIVFSSKTQGSREGVTIYVY